MKLKLKKLPKENQEEKSTIFPDKKKSENKYNTLYDAIDHTRVFQMLYSGVEDDKNFSILYDMGIRHFLMSYHYIRAKKLSTDKYRDLGVKFFIDSGAYTYRNDSKYDSNTIEDWEKHIKSYLNWLEKNQDIVYAAANLDIDGFVEPHIVQEWNEKYFEPFMLRTGIPICFIWHIEDTEKTWEQYCQRYPYVGIPYEGDIDYQYFVDKFRVAEKYKTVVHGMAMTKTSMLTTLPFFTVDSTTWMVGVQYGEINWWTGQKMTRLKKDKWKGSMLSQIVSKGFDEQKLLDEDSEELIRVNVYAFIEAEKYIQDRLKSRMYWMRPDANKRTEESISSIKFPSVEWFNDAEKQDKEWEEYAKEFNISTVDKNRAIDLICDMTFFMHWNQPEYKEYQDKVYTEDVIKQLHDMFINKMVESDEQRVEDLIDFYKANLLGENTTLLYLGTNFDKLVKEREEYIDDTEYDYEDVPEYEIDNIKAKYLPKDSSAPEISELDDEIFEEEGIIPVRDEHGHFLKGQKKIKRPKKMYSDKYPKLSCDMCMNAQRCSEYKAGYVCAFNKMFERYNSRDMEDIIQAMQGIANYSMTRVQRAMISETMNGGIPDGNVSALMDQSMRYLSMLKTMYENASQEVLRQTKTIRSDGTQEMTTQITNPSSSGILAKIFGDMGKENKEEQK